MNEKRKRKKTKPKSEEDRRKSIERTVKAHSVILVWQTAVRNKKDSEIQEIGECKKKE